MNPWIPRFVNYRTTLDSNSEILDLCYSLIEFYLDDLILEISDLQICGLYLDFTSHWDIDLWCFRPQIILFWDSNILKCYTYRRIDALQKKIS
ncbi:hypothetical protein HN011_009147 [Eciton burchellii]|nr:hypothetical protein HN011_009147 [Eciton burchellii]